MTKVLNIIKSKKRVGPFEAVQSHVFFSFFFFLTCSPSCSSVQTNGHFLYVYSDFGRINSWCSA